MNAQTTGDFERWLARGIEAGWVSKPACTTHDHAPMTDDEKERWDNDEEFCIPCLRVWVDHVVA
jgi:hypothetical protein